MSDNAISQLESVVIGGDLSKLNPSDKLMYYTKVCESVGLNPLTKPFEYIQLNGKLTLYARRDATDQLRSIHGVSVEEMTESDREGVYIVTVKVKNKDGRTDMAKGAVNVTNLKGDALANAMMKAETKAKRRATLSICGLGLLDETEVSSIPGAVTERPMITPDPVDQDKVFTAVVWFKEMIEADQIEKNWEIVQAAWAKLSNNERMEVDAKLSDKVPGANRMYRRVLKDYLDYVPEATVPEAHNG